MFDAAERHANAVALCFEVGCAKGLLEARLDIHRALGRWLAAARAADELLATR